MSIGNWPECQRPRERLLRRGPASLSDVELVAIFFRTGFSGKSALDLSRDVLAAHGGLRQLLELNQASLCKHKGIGTVKYVELQAALELGRRYLEQSLTQNRIKIPGASTAIRFLTSKLRHLKQECFAVLYLDSQNHLIDYVELSRGTVNMATVYPREVVKSALEYNAVAAIFAHNHPSGHAKPSDDDRELTATLVEALKTVDIAVFDHIVIGEGEYFSFAEHGWL